MWNSFGAINKVKNVRSSFMSEKYLAFIWHAEDYTNKDECLCYVQFLTGNLRGKTIQARLTTGIFKYYCDQLKGSLFRTRRVHHSMILG